MSPAKPQWHNSPALNASFMKVIMLSFYPNGLRFNFTVTLEATIQVQYNTIVYVVYCDWYKCFIQNTLNSTKRLLQTIIFIYWSVVLSINASNKSVHDIFKYSIFIIKYYVEQKETSWQAGLLHLTALGTILVALLGSH